MSSRPAIRRLVMLVVLGLAAAVVSVAPVNAQTAGSGMIFGVSSEPVGNETQISAIQNLERDLGTTLPLVRVFERWDSNFNNNYNNFILDGGRDIFMSIKPQTEGGRIITWTQVANARPGSAVHDEMVHIATEIGKLDGNIWLAFHHEPEAGHQAWGDADAFAAAWRNFHSVLEAEGVDATWVWTMTAWSFSVPSPDRREAHKWYPGNDFVDVVGGDLYNWNQCRSATEGWRDIQVPLDAIIDFAQDRGKQAMLPEFGVHGTGAEKARWLRETRDLLKQQYYADRMVGIIYYDSVALSTCLWPLYTSAQSMEAAREIVNDPFFRQGGVPAAPTPTTTPSPTPPANVVLCDGKVATLWGTAGNDTLRGTAGPDVIAGLQGNDTIYGLGGDDIICGGKGDDVLYGGQGFDVIFGAQDDDKLYAVDANGRIDSVGSRMYAGAGNDVVYGSSRWDRMQGGDGVDRLFGYEGRDWIRGGSGNDVLDGGGAIDDMNSGSGNDTVAITSGDKVRAGIGFDRCTNVRFAASAWGCER